jgi:hypothetical protein
MRELREGLVFLLADLKAMRAVAKAPEIYDKPIRDVRRRYFKITRDDKKTWFSMMKSAESRQPFIEESKVEAESTL